MSAALIGVFTRPVMTDATEASLSKGASRSQNAAQSTQPCAAYRPQPRAYALHLSATAWMGEGAQGAGRESETQVVAVAVGHWRLVSLDRDFRSIAGDGVHARARSPPQPYSATARMGEGAQGAGRESETEVAGH